MRTRTRSKEAQPQQTRAQEHESLVAAALRLVQRLERGRRRAEHDGDASPPRAPYGDIAPVVAHTVLLLERRIVFLVDDDETKPRHRREHGKPRPEHEIDTALRGPAPVASTHRGGKAAVQRDGPPAGQRRRDSLQELRGQIDFGNEQQRLATGCDATRRCCKVDLGLAAPRNAVQQKRGETSMRLRDRSDGALLFRIERSRRVRAHGSLQSQVRRRSRADAAGTCRRPLPERRGHLRKHEPERFLIVPSDERGELQ